MSIKLTVCFLIMSPFWNGLISFEYAERRIEWTLLESVQGSRNHLDTGSSSTERKVRLTFAQYRFRLIEVS